MKRILSIFFVFFTAISWGQENVDSSDKKLKASGSISINSNGIAPIPAFSLGDPAFISTVSLMKGRFSYTPILGYGLDLKPWFIDNWLHYKFVTRPVLELKAGFNYSTFFSDYKLPDETILQGQRYFAFALEALYTFKPKSTLLFAYWNDRGQEPGTIKGHYLSAAGERNEIEMGKYFLLSAGIQLFYINYTGENDGLFITPKLSASMKNMPLSVYFQGIQPIISNFSPSPGFDWNIGLAYNF